MAFANRLIRRLVPSMYRRRLWLLAGGALGVVGVLASQMWRLTVAEAAVWRHKAESALVQRRLIPTARGQVLDRRLRVLAMDKPSYDVGVRYPVITGEWAYRQARRAAYRANRATWPQLDEQQRDRLIAQYQPPFDAQVQQLWQALCELGGVDQATLDQRCATIVRRVKQTVSVVWGRRLKQRLAQEDKPVSLADVSQPIGEQVAAHAVLENVDHDALIRVQSHIAQADHQPDRSVWQQVSIEAARHRAYPLETLTLVLDRNTLPTPLRDPTPIEITVEGVGLHTLGALRGVWREDVQRRPYRRTNRAGRSTVDLGGYLPGDRVGYWGIEKAQEDRLRGVRGQVVARLDLDQQDRQEPAPGEDVVLTLDIRLQGRIQAIMDPRFGLMTVQPWHAQNTPSDPLRPQLGEPLNGAAVVLDVATSDVLAAVSVPGFGLQRWRQQRGSIWQDRANQPYLNRVVARAYQPGSTVKPLVLAAAVTDQQIGYDQAITCNGHLEPGFQDRYRCWIYKGYNATHGPLGGAEAIARSCNIFFYTLGRRLGAKQLVRWYDRWGLGRVTRCGLTEEIPADLPDLTRAHTPYATGFTPADAIFMGIGQGPVRWTPLQAASAYADLARGGYHITPSFVMVGDRPTAPSSASLALDPRGVEMALTGMDHAVNQRYGSAHGLAVLEHEPIFNIDGVQIYGKSGTADAVPHWVDENSDGRFTRGVDRLVRRGDHAWMICLIQPDTAPQPTYVVVVVVEYGGSGGAVAGPIVNQILHAMRAEGYL